MDEDNPASFPPQFLTAIFSEQVSDIILGQFLLVMRPCGRGLIAGWVEVVNVESGIDWECEGVRVQGFRVRRIGVARVERGSD